MDAAGGTSRWMVVAAWPCVLAPVLWKGWISGTVLTLVNDSFTHDKTQDKTKDTVRNLDPDTCMVLISYLCFRGKKPVQSRR